MPDLKQLDTARIDKTYLEKDPVFTLYPGAMRRIKLRLNGLDLDKIVSKNIDARIGTRVGPSINEPSYSYAASKRQLPVEYMESKGIDGTVANNLDSFRHIAIDMSKEAWRRNKEQTVHSGVGMKSGRAMKFGAVKFKTPYYLKVINRHGLRTVD